MTYNDYKHVTCIILFHHQQTFYENIFFKKEYLLQDVVPNFGRKCLSSATLLAVVRPKKDSWNRQHIACSMRNM